MSDATQPVADRTQDAGRGTVVIAASSIGEDEAFLQGADGTFADCACRQQRLDHADDRACLIERRPDGGVLLTRLRFYAVEPANRFTPARVRKPYSASARSSFPVHSGALPDV